MCQDIENFIHMLPLFSSLSEEDKNGVVKHSRIRAYPKRTTLFMQGDKTNFLFTVMEGWGKLYNSTPDGTEVIVDMVQHGDTFGESAIFDDMRHRFCADALKDITVLETSASFIKKLADKNALFTKHLMKNMARKIQKLNLENEHLAIMTTSQRTACFIMQIALAAGHTDNLEFPYDKQLLAIRLGMKTETFSRALHELQKLDIEIQSNNIIIRDIEKLEEHCCASCSAEPENCPLVRENKAHENKATEDKNTHPKKAA